MAPNVIQCHIPTIFTTQRIQAKKVTNDHTPYLAQIIADSKVQEACNTVDETTFTNVTAQLSIILDQWNHYGYGLYILFDKETSEFIGFAGYHTTTIDEGGMVNCFENTKAAQDLEIYALLIPQQWRKGYGFEVTTKLIDLAFEHLPYSSIIAYIEPKNTAALRGIEKLHFKKEYEVLYNNKPHILYRLHKQ